MRRDAAVDEEIRHDGNDGCAEIDQERRQPGERLQDHLEFIVQRSFVGYKRC
jgi:hypothetical protein